MPLIKKHGFSAMTTRGHESYPGYFDWTPEMFVALLDYSKKLREFKTVGEALRSSEERSERERQSSGQLALGPGVGSTHASSSAVWVQF